MTADATPRLVINPLYVLSEAQSLHSSLEYAVSAAIGVTVDDKLSPETRLVMVAMRLGEISRQIDAVGDGLVRTSAAMREAQPA